MDNTITGDQDQKPGMMETKSSDQQPIEQKAADQKPIEQKATDQKPMEQKAADQAAQEKAMVDNAFQHLLDTYLASRHRKKVGIITKAFNFARQAHQGVKRLSGEPYIMHPIAVAQIACEEIGLGATSISAALLHDVVEDTDYTVEDIENIFGPKIAQIVDGLTKISGGIFGDKASAQTENFKKLLLTMNDDIRVILIKICDRLHNMRTLASQPANKQYKIAGETLYIYAPLANRLGLNKVKTELEDLSFRYEHPEIYQNIAKQLEETQAQRDELFRDFTAPIRAALDKMGLKYEIKARVKTPFSIWNKMQKKHVSFDEIYDILAVRIVFTPNVREDEINDCFSIYVAISKIYNSHPDRLRDWVNHPKANGYQALHVTLMSNQGKWIELQIRSDRMDEIAEQGFAAHWKYKEGYEITEDEGELNDWLHTIKEILDDPQPDAMDFLDAIKLNLFSSEIFVFTPKGDFKTMPAEARRSTCLPDPYVPRKPLHRREGEPQTGAAEPQAQQWRPGGDPHLQRTARAALVGQLRGDGQGQGQDTGHPAQGGTRTAEEGRDDTPRLARSARAGAFGAAHGETLRGAQPPEFGGSAARAGFTHHPVGRRRHGRAHGQEEQGREHVGVVYEIRALPEEERRGNGQGTGRTGSDGLVGGTHHRR